jgi:hypothetical protein
MGTSVAPGTWPPTYSLGSRMFTTIAPSEWAGASGGWTNQASGPTTPWTPSQMSLVYLRVDTPGGIIQAIEAGAPT